MELHTFLVALHLLGFAFGIGGATASDLVFIRSTKDGQVSKDEYKLIKTLSFLVWTSVALLIVSGAAAMLLEYRELGEIPRLGWSFFQMKLIIFSVLVANGIIFHTKVFPYLKKSIGKSFRSASLQSKYWLFALTGAVSIVSWYTAFIMVAFSRVWNEYSWVVLITGYLMVMAFGVVGAYLTLKLHANNGKLIKTLKQSNDSQFVRVVLLIAVGLIGLLVLQLLHIHLVQSTIVL
ncbi:MAG: hypothetical protein U5K77_03495 [Candidatus Saccharibacteria bacterium]|nr:hypothetical protein [Candidatus Saccharibacteria bacterium]